MRKVLSRSRVRGRQFGVIRQLRRGRKQERSAPCSTKARGEHEDEQAAHLHGAVGAAAFAAMWRAIPLLRPLGLAARSPLILSILERGYRRFLRARPKLQRLFREKRPTA